MDRTLPTDIAAADLVMAYLEEKAVAAGGTKAIATPASFATYGEPQQGFTVLIVAKEPPSVLAAYTLGIREVFGGSEGFREYGAGFRHRAISLSLIGSEQAMVKDIYQKDPETARKAEITVRREGRRKQPILQGITV